MLKATPTCVCNVEPGEMPEWYLCPACYPMIKYRPEMVMGMASNAARQLFNRHYEGVPEYFFHAADASIIVGTAGVGYVRAISAEVFETGTIDADGFWVPA